MFGGWGKAADFGMFGVVIYKKFCFVVLMRVFLEKEEEKKPSRVRGLLKG